MPLRRSFFEGRLVVSIFLSTFALTNDEDRGVCQ